MCKNLLIVLKKNKFWAAVANSNSNQQARCYIVDQMAIENIGYL